MIYMILILKDVTYIYILLLYVLVMYVLIIGYKK